VILEQSRQRRIVTSQRIDCLINRRGERLIVGHEKGDTTGLLEEL